MENNLNSSKVSKNNEIEQNHDNHRRLSDQIILAGKEFHGSVVSDMGEDHVEPLPLDDTMVYVIHEMDVKSTQNEKIQTSCVNSLGLIKLIEIILSAVALGCIWSECKLSWYSSQYCYGKASVFQMQNLPVATCIAGMILSLIVMVAWFVTWEQPVPTNDENVYKRKTVAKVDTFLSTILLILNIASAFVEAWMTIKFNLEFSCPMCYKLALWSLATILFFISTAMYIFNLIICNQHRRFDEVVSKKF